MAVSLEEQNKYLRAQVDVLQRELRKKEALLQTIGIRVVDVVNIDVQHDEVISKPLERYPLCKEPINALSAGSC